jgi:hypothetical protein
MEGKSQISSEAGLRSERVSGELAAPTDCSVNEGADDRASDQAAKARGSSPARYGGLLHDGEHCAAKSAGGDDQRRWSSAVGGGAEADPEAVDEPPWSRKEAGWQSPPGRSGRVVPEFVNEEGDQLLEPELPEASPLEDGGRHCDAMAAGCEGIELARSLHVQVHVAVIHVCPGQRACPRRRQQLPIVIYGTSEAPGQPDGDPLAGAKKHHAAGRDPAEQDQPLPAARRCA